jgi:hypothetical protein
LLVANTRQTFLDSITTEVGTWNIKSAAPLFMEGGKIMLDYT